MVIGDLSELFERTSRSAITIAPHLLAPRDGEDRAERELNILQSGVFNAGVIGVRRGETADRFLGWWQGRVYSDCRHSLDEGVHYDQRWLDLVPAFFEDVGVVRDPAYKTAHWNLPERDGADCRLFHFSGYDRISRTGHPIHRPRENARKRSVSQALRALPRGCRTGGLARVEDVAPCIRALGQRRSDSRGRAPNLW